MEKADRFYKTSQDFRNPYSRDRDRIIHSSSFRRLEYKTQVFLNHEGDYFRTRLTHSLEVSQIARTIACELGLEESLAEAIALSHDLGHTPFGHLGGDTLDLLLKEDGHPFGFEHNFQSFRVVTKLEKRYKEYDGLNLTYATLEGILKHSYPYKKDFLKGLEEEFDFDMHPAAEAMVVDLSDEIAYTSHDIDDGIKYGLIDFDEILDLDLPKEIDRELQKEDYKKGSSFYRHRFVARLITLLVTDVMRESKKQIDIYGAKSQIKATEAGVIMMSSGLSSELKRLKKRLYEILYRHEKIEQKMHAGKVCIERLYKAYTTNPNLLPKSQRILLDRRNKERVVADYIASMTDRFALKNYHELFGLSL